MNHGLDREIKTIEELRDFARDFLGVVRSQTPREGALVVALSGELGAGKTTFTKEVASLVGIPETVTSPTFVLEKLYSIPAGDMLPEYMKMLVHIDLYRLDGVPDLAALDWERLVRDPANIIFVEWAERIATVLPRTMIAIMFEHTTEGRRLVRVTGI